MLILASSFVKSIEEQNRRKLLTHMEIMAKTMVPICLSTMSKSNFQFYFIYKHLTIGDITQYSNAGHNLASHSNDLQSSYRKTAKPVDRRYLSEFLVIKPENSHKACNVVTRFTFLNRIRTSEKPRDTQKPVFLTMFLICKKKKNTHTESILHSKVRHDIYC